MKLECLTTFKEGREIYEKGDIRTVPDSIAHRALGLGWAREVGKDGIPLSSGDAALNIHKSAIGLGDSNG